MQFKVLSRLPLIATMLIEYQAVAALFLLAGFTAAQAPTYTINVFDEDNCSEPKRRLTLNRDDVGRCINVDGDSYRFSTTARGANNRCRVNAFSDDNCTGARTV